MFDLPSKFDAMVKVRRSTVCVCIGVIVCSVCVCMCVCMCTQEQWRDTMRVTLCVPTKLPELKDRPADFLDRMRANSRPGG